MWDHTHPTDAISHRGGGGCEPRPSSTAAVELIICLSNQVTCVTELVEAYQTYDLHDSLLVPTSVICCAASKPTIAEFYSLTTVVNICVHMLRSLICNPH